MCFALYEAASQQEVRSNSPLQPFEQYLATAVQQWTARCQILQCRQRRVVKASTEKMTVKVQDPKHVKATSLDSRH